MLLQYINKCLCWGRSMWAQWLNSNSLFWSAPERLEDLRHLRANYEKHTQAIFFCIWSHGPLWGSKSTDIWGTEKREVWAESSIMMTMFHKALVSSSHRTAKTVDKPERISTCIYQEAGHIPACQASLKYVNVLMLFHWETTIWGSLDWWHVQMDWNYVQFVFFHSGSFESVYVTEGYLHILCGNAYCLCGWLDLSWLVRLCYSVLVQCSESHHGMSFKGFYNVHSTDLIYAVKRVMLSVRDNKTAAHFLQLPKGRFCCSQ